MLGSILIVLSIHFLVSSSTLACDFQGCISNPELYPICETSYLNVCGVSSPGYLTDTSCSTFLIIIFPPKHDLKPSMPNLDNHSWHLFLFIFLYVQVLWIYPLNCFLNPCITANFHLSYNNLLTDFLTSRLVSFHTATSKTGLRRKLTISTSISP